LCKERRALRTANRRAAAIHVRVSDRRPVVAEQTAWRDVSKNPKRPVHDSKGGNYMRYWVGGAAIAGLAVALLAGCESDSSSRGFSSVTITGEEEQTVSGNLCAVRGHATNTGNRRARVRITYEAKNSGNVIATSVAEFEVAAFSNFDFANNVANNQGQPSSGVFVPPVSCATIDDIDRKSLDVDAS
jgi:hypothetical protein